MSSKLAAIGVFIGGAAVGFSACLWFLDARTNTSRFLGADLLQNLSEAEIEDLIANKGEKIYTYTCVNLNTICTFVVEGEWPIILLLVLVPALSGLLAYRFFTLFRGRKSKPA